MELIDWDRVMELKDEVGDDAFAEILEMSVEELEETFARIASSPQVTAADMHFLKGASLNLGLAQLAEVCKSGEMALRDDSTASIDLSAIRRLYDDSRREVIVLAQA